MGRQALVIVTQTVSLRCRNHGDLFKELRNSSSAATPSSVVTQRRTLTVCVTFERDSIGEDEANYRTRYNAGHIRWANRQAKAPD